MDVSVQKCDIPDIIDCTFKEPCPPLNVISRLLSKTKPGGSISGFSFNATKIFTKEKRPLVVNLLTSSLKLQLGNKVKTEQDALEAVKLDPAVLEAQITVDTGNSIKEKPSASKDDQPQRQTSFENVISMQEAALLSLEPDQFEFLMMYAEALRRKRIAVQKTLECAFCKNNGESLSWYTSHALKDERGRVRCPVLRGFRCPRCGATGDRAHTIKYCPEYPEPGN